MVGKCISELPYIRAVNNIPNFICCLQNVHISHNFLVKFFLLIHQIGISNTNRLCVIITKYIFLFL